MGNTDSTRQTLADTQASPLQQAHQAGSLASSDLFYPGMRVAVACSGGADSVGLFRSLLDQRNALGLVLSIVHVNHGLRGAESDQDEAFVAKIASTFSLPFHSRKVDTSATASSSGEGVEETGRKLRYAWFWELLAENMADAVVTAHTLDDQAETVLHRLIRGAWTEGLGGIHPLLKPPATQPGLILRPFLSVTRAQIEARLQAIKQPWREDSSNRDLTYTRNRLRHELLPQLAMYNPQIFRQLAQLATLARDEESFWRSELARISPALLLPGNPVRGGGRSVSTLPGSKSIAVEIERLRGLHPALRRRLLREAADRLGVSIDFADTENLLTLCGLNEAANSGKDLSASRLQLKDGLRAERGPRELRLSRLAASPPTIETENPFPTEYTLPVPGAVEAPAFGLHLEAVLVRTPKIPLPAARLRLSRPSDRVTLRHSRSRLKIKEALQRARLPAVSQCPVLEWQGEIVWVSGIAIESGAAQAAFLTVVSNPLKESTTVDQPDEGN